MRGPATPCPPLTVDAPRLAAPADEPPAVTSIPADELDAAGIEGTRDLEAMAPGLVVSQNGDRKSAFIGVRGLSNSGFGDSSVGLYVDGVPYADQRGALVELYDVESVDVLRGPQTTTFGRNAEAGAIDVHTPTPGNDVRARGTIRLGSYAEQTYQASASGPVVPDRVFASVAGIESRRDGYVRNAFLHDDLDDRQLAGGRGRLVALPFPGLELSLAGEGRHADDGGQAFVLLDQPDPFVVRYDTRGSGKLDVVVGAFRARWETPSVVVTSLTAYRDFDAYDDSLDLDFTPAPVAVLHDDYRFADWTEEVRAASERPGDRWRWHVGGFFEDKTTEPHVTAHLAALRVDDRQAAHFDAQTWAGFGQTAVTVLPGLDLVGGLRIEHFRVAMHRTHVQEVADGPAVPVVPAFQVHQQTLAWLPLVRLAWTPVPTASVYASATRGYRQGGFSHLTDDEDAARFRPAFNWTYELGARTSWLADRLVTALTVYWARVGDYQNVERAGLTGFTVRNARRASARGVEMEIDASPANGLDVGVGASVGNARYDDFCDPGSRRCFDGNTIRLAPDYELNAAITYRHPSGFVAQAGCHATGGYPFLEDNVRSQEPYQLVTARIGWEWRHFGVYAYGRNLADQTYHPFAIPPSGPTGYVSNPGDPRTVGVMLTARY